MKKIMMVLAVAGMFTACSGGEGSEANQEAKPTTKVSDDTSVEDMLGEEEAAPVETETPAADSAAAEAQTEGEGEAEAHGHDHEGHDHAH